MASNAWSIRRGRIPRPIVCKSKDPYENWPLTVSLEMNWSVLVGIESTDFSGPVTCVRVIKTMAYTGIGIDLGGMPFKIFAVLPQQIGPGGELTATVMVDARTTANDPAIMTGNNFAWFPGGAFQAPTRNLIIVVGAGAGDWTHNLGTREQYV